MDPQSTPPAGVALAPAEPSEPIPTRADMVEVCASCATVHPSGFRCPCIIDRAEALAALVHEVRRFNSPAWRRPRSWERLPEPVRQTLTGRAQDVIECLEGAGWRFVSTAAIGRHSLILAADQPASGAGWDPDDPDPRTEMFHVPNVVR
jgi:hypothetical protein